MITDEQMQMQIMVPGGKGCGSVCSLCNKPVLQGQSFYTGKHDNEFRVAHAVCKHERDAKDRQKYREPDGVFGDEPYRMGSNVSAAGSRMR